LKLREELEYKELGHLQGIGIEFGRGCGFRIDESLDISR
jgi:hypothetical protein